MVKRVPRYITIKRRILSAMKDKDFLSNGRLPSEEELARIFNASRTTIRSALQALEVEGIILKKHGSGNFVRLHGKYPEWNATFTIIHFDINEMPILKEKQFRNIRLPEYVAQKLNMTPGVEVLEITRIIQKNGKDSIGSVEIFPIKFLKRIPVKEEEIPDSIFDFINDFCGIEVKEISSDILAINAEESPFKEVKRPVLKFEDVFFDYKGQPFAYSDFYINLENVHPHIIRNRPPFSWKVV
ncbi:MAG: GntR family transcriptional regulator [Candidatus Caldatribacteriota bacterium]